jgi:hypothetical protein
MATTPPDMTNTQDDPTSPDAGADNPKAAM